MTKGSGAPAEDTPCCQVIESQDARGEGDSNSPAGTPGPRRGGAGTMESGALFPASPASHVSQSQSSTTSQDFA